MPFNLKVFVDMFLLFQLASCIILYYSLNIEPKPVLTGCEVVPFACFRYFTVSSMNKTVQSTMMNISVYCLSVHSHNSKTTWQNSEFLCMLSAAVTQFFCRYCDI